MMRTLHVDEDGSDSIVLDDVGFILPELCQQLQVLSLMPQVLNLREGLKFDIADGLVIVFGHLRHHGLCAGPDVIRQPHCMVMVMMRWLLDQYARLLKQIGLNIDLRQSF